MYDGGRKCYDLASRHEPQKSDQTSVTAMDRRNFCRTLAAAGAVPVLPAVSPALAEDADPACSAAYPAVLGETRHYVTTYEDSLVDLAYRFGLGFTEIVAANPGIDPWVPGEGRRITLPTAHLLPRAPCQGLVLNLSCQRLYFFHPDGKTVDTAPVGVGDVGWQTPLGTTRVVRKGRNPTWYVPKSVRKEQPELPAIVPPGPDNPLGKFALYLGWDAYLIHGTNKPFGIGRRATHGCVRLYPEDIARIYAEVPLGTPVRVVEQDVKIARAGEQLWLEIHPSPAQAVELEETGTLTPVRPPELIARVLLAAGDDRSRVNWSAVSRAGLERHGIPIPILDT